MSRAPRAGAKNRTQTSVPLCASLLGQITNPSDTWFLFLPASQVNLKGSVEDFSAKAGPHLSLPRRNVTQGLARRGAVEKKNVSWRRGGSKQLGLFSYLPGQHSRQNCFISFADWTLLGQCTGSLILFYQDRAEHALFRSMAVSDSKPRGQGARTI